MIAPLPEIFRAGLDRLGPFEHRPHLVVAVSGGPDSLALALLAQDWVAARGGRLTALTVDHRLRPGSTAEAEEVGRWLAARSIEHHVLDWIHDGQGPRRGGVQALARTARYRLLEAWCEAAGCLHLLTAHHRDDQSETVLIRLARGSGLDGLAAMPAIVERPFLRLLRPLLDVPGTALRDYVRAQGQAFIEDPSNRNADFTRVRLRTARAVLEAAGLTAGRLAETASHLARARSALEEQTALLLARSVTLHPEGYADMLTGPVIQAAPEVGLRAFAAVLATISGAEYPPRFERLERLFAWLRAGADTRGRTLGGCRVVPRADGMLLICREPSAIAAPLPLLPGPPVVWDRRFRVRLVPEKVDCDQVRGENWSIRALDPAIWLAIDADRRSSLRQVPSLVRPTLPAIHCGTRLVAVPSLGFWQPAAAEPVDNWRTERCGCPVELVFRPHRSLTTAGFTGV
jgi:tRNA(Ile)-lysidine synthase